MRNEARDPPYHLGDEIDVQHVQEVACLLLETELTGNELPNGGEHPSVLVDDRYLRVVVGTRAILPHPQRPARPDFNAHRPRDRYPCPGHKTVAMSSDHTAWHLRIVGTRQ